MLEKITGQSNFQKQSKSTNVRNNYTRHSLERSPNADKISLSKNTKTLIALTGIATGILGIILGSNKTYTNQKTKELEKIEHKFLKLQNKLSEVQKTFQKVFLRDITQEETIKMLERYKDIEKIAVTGTKEEYMLAMFNEAKKNYQLEELPSELKIVNKPIMGDEKILGFTNPLGDITIKSTIEHRKIIDTIHHELRHLKQRQYAFNLSPEEYVKYNQPKNGTIPQEVFEYALGKVDISNVSIEYLEFAQNSQKGVLSYRSVKDNTNDYFTQWIEQDAYNAGQEIAKLFN